jgi:hypothetical protein
MVVTYFKDKTRVLLVIILYDKTFPKDSTYKIQGTTNVLVDIGCRTSRKRVSVFGFTRPGLKPTIYRTRGEHSNHYTTEVKKCILREA